MKNYVVKQLYSSAKYPLLFLLVVWVVFLIQLNSSKVFMSLGVLPREAIGLIGIITSVFIHGDLNHILSNTLPILALGTMLFYFYKKIALQSAIWIWLISGVWLWIGGRNSLNHPTYHIGASTLVYGFSAFLFFSGVFRRHLRLMVVSALVVFLYGSIVWGIFPLKQEISWEGHFFGALAGILVAYSFRKEGPQPRVYVWDDEEEDLPIINSIDQPDTHSEVKINYIYQQKTPH